ncbi:MAG: RNA polymerase sigma-70 factor [Parabacteroides sp.]|nr:RNA polymerase sigma-70 factor [Parabacteroides sp.]
MVDFSDDNLLVKEIKKGNKQAFEYLFKSYYPRLRGYAIRFVEDEETVCDIIQECFLHLWEKRTYLTSLSLSSLLFAIVRNGCLNHLKHQAIVEKHRIEYSSGFQGEERLYATDFSMDTEYKLLYDELQQQIGLVIGRLPERCREVFILSRFEGLKNREIAEKLHISLKAVEVHISKALQSFSNHFKEKYPVDIYLIIIAWLIR